jgi:hypothetical protein
MLHRRSRHQPGVCSAVRLAWQVLGGDGLGFFDESRGWRLS